MKKYVVCSVVSLEGKTKSMMIGTWNSAVEYLGQKKKMLIPRVTEETHAHFY